MTLDWDAVFTHALALEDASADFYYGEPTVKVNGRPLISPGREAGSFVLHIDPETKLMLLETDPATFWQTPHYEGWPGLLVRYDTADPARVLALIERSRAWALARKPPKPRKAK